jgi:hypothetical protein
MKKRCQFSMEFIMLFALVFFLFAVLLAMMGRLADDKRQETLQQKFDSVADSIQGSLMLATSASGYEAEISVPADIDGLDYDIVIIDKNNLRVYSDEHSVYRDIPHTEGSISKGCNRIVKSGEVISIGSC